MMTMPLKRKSMHASILILFLMIPVACMRIRAPEVRVTGEKSGIEAHVWARLTDESQVDDAGYGMYTYVLLNQDLRQDETSTKYRDLIDAIVASTLSQDETRASEAKSNLNLFLIPFRKDRSDSINTTLSKKILMQFSLNTTDAKLKNVIASRPGPFLISVPQPVSLLADTSKIPMLYVDLSGTNVYAIPEVVTAYKQRLVDKSVGSVERFQSFRLMLLNTLLIGNDCVQLVKDAYAGWSR
jgi:hypothetical protein